MQEPTAFCFYIDHPSISEHVVCFSRATTAISGCGYGSGLRIPGSSSIVNIHLRCCRGRGKWEGIGVDCGGEGGS